MQRRQEFLAAQGKKDDSAGGGDAGVKERKGGKDGPQVDVIRARPDGEEAPAADAPPPAEGEAAAEGPAEASA
jgi:hypothetical protein